MCVYHIVCVSLRVLHNTLWPARCVVWLPPQAASPWKVSNLLRLLWMLLNSLQINTLFECACKWLHKHFITTKFQSVNKPASQPASQSASLSVSFVLTVALSPFVCLSLSLFVRLSVCLGMRLCWNQLASEFSLFLSGSLHASFTKALAIRNERQVLYFAQILAILTPLKYVHTEIDIQTYNYIHREQRVPCVVNVVLIFNERRSRKSYIISSKSGNFNFNMRAKGFQHRTPHFAAHRTCSHRHQHRRRQREQHNTTHTRTQPQHRHKLKEESQLMSSMNAPLSVWLTGWLAAWYPASTACWKCLHTIPLPDTPSLHISPLSPAAISSA